MKKLLLLLAATVLVGCIDTEGAPPCNTKYAYDNDKVGTSGLVLKATNSPFITFEEMESIYKGVESCLKLSAPGPTVEYKSFKSVYLGGGWAVFMPANTLVWMNIDESIAPRNCHSDRQAIKHEFVHHVLYMNGKNYGHGSPEFGRCGAYGVNTCNGVPCE